MILIGLFLGYRLLIEYPQEVETLSHYQERELQSLANGLQLNLTNLSTIVRDYARWDDTHEYMLDPDAPSDFPDENFVPSVFATFDLLAVGLYDLSFKPRFRQGFDLEEEDFVDITEIMEQPLANTLATVTSHTPPYQGWVMTARGPAAFAIDTVTNTDEDAPPSGYLVFLQALTKEHISRLEQITRLKVELSEPTGADVAFPSLTEPELLEGVVHQRQRVLLDISGAPILTINIFHELTDDPTAIGWSETLLLSLLLLTPVVIGLFVDRYIVQPLRSSTARIQKMVEKQKIREIPKGVPINELDQIRCAFNSMVRLVRQQKQALRKMSLTDSLTGIGNRRDFDASAHYAWRRAMRRHDSFTLALIDLDYFKNFNDALGHLEGDRALQQVGLTLKGFIRRAGESCARLGGEEFALFFSGETERDALQRLNQLRIQVASLGISHPQSPIAKGLTCSIGAIHIANPGVDYRHLKLEELLTKADKQLYGAKAEGRNKVLFESFSLPMKNEEQLQEPPSITQ
ncbi:diguanylate cyclase [Aliiglaciecola sp. CAU 1673]|uniref:sensor domain-containing diguanylate cyclase n=1 Tax=Aliiglaciecola sp. CAU 1673 TaxID=3032595 RepID=UPI0023DA7C28|nr:diguanylate cyclase [Aliiglaciecola sp. CAU 1673]MDF2177015.1 diguanylate cyclase [Aliiglaciecola sp. CAU 1673]